MKNKTYIKFALREIFDYDFGMISFKVGDEIDSGGFSVDENLWKEYVEARTVFEMLHWKIAQQVPAATKRILASKWHEENVAGRSSNQLIEDAKRAGLM